MSSNESTQDVTPGTEPRWVVGIEGVILDVVSR